MSVTQQYRATIQKLKKRIHTLERQQEQGRKKLQQAMNEARKLAKSYQSKLNAKVHHVAGKEAAGHAVAYARAALKVERSLLKAAEKKAKALASAVMEMDRKHITDLIKGLLGNIRKKSAVKKPAKKPKRKSTR